jgi:methyltransferase (TIGR00027 family)
LVVLGAGYDTRAFRIEKLKRGVPVFELDHPATQKSKKEIVKGLFGEIPEHVRYIPVDFERDRVCEKLLLSDYDPGLETFFIWEGVTYYLTGEAVDLTLESIAAHSPARSRLAFDYFPPCAADGTCEIPGARTLVYGLEKFGEKIAFGIDPAELESFLWKRGFRLEINLNSTDCEKLFFKRKRGLCALFNFAAARVRAKP